MLTNHFCVIDGEQHGYSNTPLYTEFRVYLNKAREMHPDKYSKFLSEADESVLSAFSFEYDPEVFKRVIEKFYCPWVYAVLFHDKIHKSMIPIRAGSYSFYSKILSPVLHRFPYQELVA